MEPEKTYTISATQVKGLLEYMATRPYQEVVNGIAWLQSLQEVKEIVKDENKPE